VLFPELPNSNNGFNFQFSNLQFKMAIPVE
jgi:hypothetical protein